MLLGSLCWVEGGALEGEGGQTACQEVVGAGRTLPGEQPVFFNTAR